jgi:hypothetical protein
MSTLPDALTRLSKQLSIPSEEWWEHDADYHLGFFRRGHPTLRRFCYWQRDGVIRGLTIRGHAVGTTDWLDDPAWAELEDLLFIDTDITSLTVPPKIKRLDVSDCDQLSELQFTGEAIPLTDLFGQRSGLETIEFPACPDLRCLHLRSCPQLVRVDFKAPPTGLGVLELEGCPNLEALPAGAILQDELFYLDARGTLPRNCPAVFTDTEKLSQEYLPRIQAWFKALEQGSEPNRFVKLLINGNGSVGKTTLWCALKNYEEHRCTKTVTSTLGVELTVDDVEIGDVYFRGWDFGGQETYHGTHRLFFVDDAVNILVSEAENERAAQIGTPVADPFGGKTFNQPLEYFYEQHRQAGDRNKYVIVQAKHGEDGQEHDIPIALADKYDLDYHFIDSRVGGRKIQRLRRDLEDLAKELHIYNMSFPKTWLAVRNWLAANRRQSKYPIRSMGEADFLAKMAEEVGLTTEALELEPLLYYLHAAGDVYRIVSDEEEKDNTLILDLRWALHAIYRPLDRGEFSRRIEERGGVGYTEDLFRAFGDRTDSYTPAQQRTLLDFMFSCGMCYPEGEREHYRSVPRRLVFPQFLPEQVDPTLASGWEKTDKIVYRARLPFRDIATFHALQCDLGAKARRRDMWRYGVYLNLVDDREHSEEAQRRLPESRAMVRFFGRNAERAENYLELSLLADSGESWVASFLEWIKNKFGELEWEQVEESTSPQPVVPVSEQATTIELKDTRSFQERYMLYAYFWQANPSTTDHLKCEEEWKLLKQDQDERDYTRKRIDFHYCKELSYGKLVRYLSDDRRPYDILHFAGHGKNADVYNDLPGGLLLNRRDEEGAQLVTAETLKRLLVKYKEKHPELRLVLLNACFSEEQAIAISEAGVFVVGTLTKINDEAAKEFAYGFYGKIEELPQDENALRELLVEAMDTGCSMHLPEYGKFSKEYYQLYYNGNPVPF